MKKKFLAFGLSACMAVPALAGTTGVFAQDNENIAQKATSITQSIDKSLWSDSLEAITDGVKVPAPHTSGANTKVWTNYNSAQAGNPEAEIEFKFNPEEPIKEIVLYQYTDNFSADLPSKVNFAFAWTSTKYNQNLSNLSVELTSEERLSSTTVKQVYTLSQTVYAIDLKIVETAKDGLKNGKRPYCVGLTEVEIYGSDTVSEEPVTPAEPGKISKNQIDYLFVGSEEPNANNYRLNAIDGDPDTIWHTKWSGATIDERYIAVALKEETEISGLNYLPRRGNKSGDNNGRVGDYAIVVSTDGKEWTQVTSGHWTNDSNLKTATFTPVKAKYIALYGLTTYGDGGENKFMSAAEIELLTPAE